jgi:hypothetical protein
LTGNEISLEKVTYSVTKGMEIIEQSDFWKHGEPDYDSFTPRRKS